jgi:hypothetical protein
MSCTKEDPVCTELSWVAIDSGMWYWITVLSVVRVIDSLSNLSDLITIGFISVSFQTLSVVYANSADTPATEIALHDLFHTSLMKNNSIDSVVWSVNDNI